MRHILLLAGLLAALAAAPGRAQFAVEEADESGVLNPSDFSWRYYLDQLNRFPERIGIICYNAYLLDKTGRHGEGLAFFRECARRGNPASMIYLAALYEQGNGKGPNLAEAARWLRRAAELGYAPGQYHYGVALLLGRGVARDSAAGRAWIEKAAAQGDASAVELIRSGYDLAPSSGSAARGSGNELSYDAWIDSPRRLKCLYGYVADKTGDHAAAVRIFEDCIARWNDVYSMIWLAQIYETGVGVPLDPAYATALMKRGAETDDPAGYASLARYHYGMALVQGRGIAPDAAAGLRWLRRAAAEGVAEAREYLDNIPADRR